MSRHYKWKVLSIPGDGYVVTFTTNPQILMHIPKKGVFQHKASRSLTLTEAKVLANWISKVLNLLLVANPTAKIKTLRKAVQDVLFIDTH